MENMIVELAAAAQPDFPLSPVAEQGVKPRGWDMLLEAAKTQYEALRPDQERSNAGLYAILADCLAVYQIVLRNSAAMKGFKAKCEKAGVNLGKRAKPEHKVIKYVFNFDRRKLSAYARVISVAHKQNQKPEGLSDWIAQSGGIEEIRRASTKGGLTRLQAIRVAREFLSKAPALGVVTDTDEALKPKNGNFTVVLLRYDKNCCSVAYALTEKTPVENVLASAGRKIAADEDSRKAEKIAAERKTKRSAVITKGLRTVA